MLLSIFTPTYNRKALLQRAYNYLCKQTCIEFQWIIVDDGSTDNTGEMVKEWKKKAPFPIKYYYQINSGKMKAHNQGVLHADTELFICLDSDDYLTENAVETIYTTWNHLKEQGLLGGLAGIIAYKGKDYSHTMNGEVFPDTQMITQSELYQKGFRGETMLVYKTLVLREYPFPIFPGETFIPESVVFDEIDKKYHLYILPKILMICEYQPDGLTNSIQALRKNNPNGWLLYYQSRIKGTSVSLLRYKYIVHAICFTWLVGVKSEHAIPASPIEIILAMPAALILKLMGRL